MYGGGREKRSKKARAAPSEDVDALSAALRDSALKASAKAERQAQKKGGKHKH